MTTGVIVGRFQISNLHDGHRSIIDYIMQQCDYGVVIIGNSPLCLTDKNPLSAEIREIMILEKYPTAHIFILDDHPSDEVWSENLDNLLKNYSGVTLYGSRDCFLPSYRGKHIVSILPEVPDVSATSFRKSLAKSDGSNYWHIPAFRAGIIYAVEKKYPTAYATVDIAVIDGKNILLGRKKGSEKLVFIGGFVDPTDQSMMSAAYRELREEVPGVTTHGLNYVGSYKIDDRRYRGTKDGIITTFFFAYYMSGSIKAADDIEEACFWNIDHLKKNKHLIADNHHILFDALIER